MNDHPDFEARLTSAFGKYADRAPVEVDPVSMTGVVARRRSRLAWPTLNRRMAWLAVGAALALLALGAALAGSSLLRTHAPVGGGGLMLIAQTDWPGSDATTQVTEHVFTFDEATGDRVPILDCPRFGSLYWVTPSAWSPDRTHAVLAYCGGVQEGVVDMASHQLSPLQLQSGDTYVNGLQAPWAPTGDRIASIVLNDTTNTTGTILISDVNGREIARLPIPAGWSGGEPTWSPDGSSMILSGHADGGQADVSTDWHLFLVPLDGSPVRALLEPALLEPAAGDFSPVWSPDRSTLAFESPTGIQTLNVATGRQTTIARGEYHAPVWSPDGRRIAFAGPCCADVNGAISVVDADGSNLYRLTSGLDTTPIWSPDGTMILFRRQAGVHPDVWVIGADGASPRLLVADAVAGW